MELNSVIVCNCQKKKAAVGQTCSQPNNYYTLSCARKVGWFNFSYHTLPPFSGYPTLSAPFQHSLLSSLPPQPLPSYIPFPIPLSTLPLLSISPTPPLPHFLPLPSTSPTLYVLYPSPETQRKEREIFCFFFCFIILLFPLCTELPCRWVTGGVWSCFQVWTEFLPCSHRRSQRENPQCEICFLGIV